MRAITGGERTAIAAPAGHSVFAYMEVTNFDGTWIHLGELAYGSRTIDALISAVLTDNIDANTPSLTATFRRNVGNYSLSPFRSDSPWNVDDSGGLYQPLLDLHRQWRLWVAVLARGTFPADPSDYREMARGVVDKIEIAGDPATITVTGRGPEADLIDHWIPTDNPTTYPGDDIGPMLQAILDNELGAGAVTLVLDPSAPSEFINDYTPAGIGLMAALTSIANLATGVLRFRYDASDVLALTLFTPNRTPVSPDWSLDSGAEIEALDASMELGSVANNIVVRYLDANGVIQTVTSPASGTSASIDRYGLRTTEIDLSADTRVRTSTAAQGLADAVCADRQWPLLDQQATAAGIWFGDLWDFVGIGANGIHFDQDQTGGVVTLEQRLEGGDLTSSFGLSGAPKGRYTTWDTFGGPAAAPLVPTLTSLAATYEEVDIGGLLGRLAYVRWTAIPGQYTKSVLAEISTSDDFATIIATQQVDATPGTAVSDTTLIDTPDRDVTYYVRATPYSGPIVAGAVSGTAGEQYVANTYAPLKPSDSPTLEWDYSTPGELKANVVGVSGAAPDDPEYLVGAATADLTNERVVTDTATVGWDLATAGQAKANVNDDSLGLAKLSATGTKDATTFLRGDNTFAVPQASGTTGPSQVYQTIVKTTASLADGASDTILLDLAPTVAFQQITVSAAAWCKVYNSMAALLADVGRSITSDPVQGSTGEPIFEVAPGLGGTSTTTVLGRNFVAHNNDSPRIGRFYMRVTNKSGATAAITVTIRYLPLEGQPAAIPSDVAAGMIYRFNAQSVLPAPADGTETLVVPNTGSLGGNFTSASTSGSGPKYKTNRINGKPALYVVSIGGNTRPYVPSVAVPGGVTEAHVFAALRPVGGGVGWDIGGGSVNTAFPNVTGNVTDQFASTTSHTVPVTSPGSGLLYHAHSSAAIWEAYQGLTQVFTTPTNTFAWGTVLLGGYFAGGFFTTMGDLDLGEVRIYTGALSSDDVLGIKLQMAADWSMSL